MNVKPPISPNAIFEAQPLGKFLEAERFEPCEIKAISRQVGVRPFRITESITFFIISIGSPYQEFKYWYPKYVKTEKQRHSFAYKQAMHLASVVSKFDYVD